MVTLNFKILPNRRKASNKLGIYLAVSHKKETRYISTEFEIDDTFQFEKGKVCYRKDSEIMNKRMDYVLKEYNERSVDFLNYFNRWGGNYVLNSVIVCVAVPIFIYVGLILLILTIISVP